MSQGDIVSTCTSAALEALGKSIKYLKREAVGSSLAYAPQAAERALDSPAEDHRDVPLSTLDTSNPAAFAR